jgi:hypothetical protein
MRYMAAVGYPEERIRNQELNRTLRNSLDSLETCDGCEVGSNVVVYYNSTTVVVQGSRKAKNGIRAKRPPFPRPRTGRERPSGARGRSVARVYGTREQRPPDLGSAGLLVEAQASLSRRFAKAWHVRIRVKVCINSIYKT